MIKNGEIVFRDGYVWFGEDANERIFDPSDYKQGEIAASQQLHSQPQSICLRFHRIVEIIQFGILGCRFVPENAGNTIIKVSYRDEYEMTPPIGLSEELADVILKEAIEVLSQENFLGSGTLFFDRGMYHVVNSTPWIFKLLTRGGLSFLNPRMQLTTVDEVDAFIGKLVKEH